MTAPLVASESVGKSYRRGLVARGAATLALRDFSLIFNENEPRIVALAGQSGSGKTTAAQLVLGLDHPTNGEIRYRGRPLPALSRKAWRDYRRDVQAVLQDPYGAFNPFYRAGHVFNVAARKFGIGKDADRAQAIAAALEFVGLDPGKVLGRYPHELSGGERQRLMIARAFLLRPRLIVADEPVSMVDASLRATILEIIIRLKKDEGISFLYITHDLSTAYHIADELIVLLDGETVERGPARSVIDAPQHSYTRLLVGSVPVPDPDVRWDQSGEVDGAGPDAVPPHEGHVTTPRGPEASSPNPPQNLGADRREAR